MTRLCVNQPISTVTPRARMNAAAPAATRVGQRLERAVSVRSRPYNGFTTAPCAVSHIPEGDPGRNVVARTRAYGPRKRW